MSNGAGLLGDNSSTESALIVPLPQSNTLYYVFTIDDGSQNSKLRYSVVDITLNGGKGAVTSKNIVVASATREKLAGVKHSNNTDVWVMVHGETTDNFLCYLVTSAGVAANPVVSAIGPTFSISLTIGYMKFSDDGTKLAVACYQGYFINLFDFDASTGMLSNEKTLYPPGTVGIGVYGVEFSNNLHYLYATLFTTSQIVQWDITSGIDSVINASLQTVGFSSAVYLGALQKGPDHKIYVARHLETFLGVIIDPDLPGIACNYLDSAISLNGKRCEIGLPNFIANYYNTTGINSLTVKNEISVYPNPFTNEINFTGLKDADFPSELKLYDVTGRIVFAETIRNATAKPQIKNYSGTVFVYELKNKNGLVSRNKILKNTAEK